MVANNKVIRSTDSQEFSAENGNLSLPSGRSAAGENPVKRNQILDGAKQVFIAQGYEGASMNDITRAAGVSKGTIYVYFQCKEDLFAALVNRERDRVYTAIHNILVDDKPLEDVLLHFGMVFARHMTAPHTIRGMRMAIGVIEKLPEVAAAFLASGPAKSAQPLREYLERHVARGELEIDDCLLAARQFAELCVAGQFRNALFGETEKILSDGEIEVIVKSAINMFMKTYAVKQ